MRGLSTVLGYSALLLSALVGSAGASTQDNNKNNTVSTIFQLDSNGTWFENLAIRQNGHILATRIDVPEIWSIDPSASPDHAGSRLYSMPDVKSLLGIVEIEHDVYAVVAGNFSIEKVQPTKGSFAVWRVDLSADDPSDIQAKLITRIPEAEFLDGMTRFNEDLLLVTDAIKGVIWRVDLKTGEYSQAISDASMVPESGQPVPVGVNGVKVHDNHVYFSSTTQEIFARVPVDAKDASPTGDVEILASGFVVDDFWLLEDGSVYAATNTLNSILKISPDGGNVRQVAGNAFRLTVAGSTAVVMGHDRDGSVLYVTTAGGQVAPVLCKTVEPAKVVAIRV